MEKLKWVPEAHFNLFNLSDHIFYRYWKCEAKSYIFAQNYEKGKSKFYIFLPNCEIWGCKIIKFSKFLKKGEGLNSTILKTSGLNSTVGWKRVLNRRAYLLTSYMGCPPWTLTTCLGSFFAEYSTSNLPYFSKNLKSWWVPASLSEWQTWKVVFWYWFQIPIYWFSFFCSNDSACNSYRRFCMPCHIRQAGSVQQHIRWSGRWFI